MAIDQTMPDFDQMQYQSKVLTELRYITQTKKIPNALLFFGNKNTGRKKAAFLVAKECNCLSVTTTSNCNCRSCKKIDANSHPDILCVDKKKDKVFFSMTGWAIGNKPFFNSLNQNIAVKTVSDLVK